MTNYDPCSDTLVFLSSLKRKLICHKSRIPFVDIQKRVINEVAFRSRVVSRNYDRLQLRRDVSNLDKIIILFPSFPMVNGFVVIIRKIRKVKRLSKVIFQFYSFFQNCSYERKVMLMNFLFPSRKNILNSCAISVYVEFLFIEIFRKFLLESSPLDYSSIDL